VKRAFKLAILNSHPIQYFAPLYRRLAQDRDLDITVFYCSRQGAESYVDAGFGVTMKWDIPLLEGYNYQFLPNLRQRDKVGGFFSLINVSIVSELRKGKFDAIWLHGHGHATNILALLAARLMGTAVYIRGDTHLGLRRSRLKKLLRKPVMSFFYRYLCTGCLPVGSRNKAFYQHHGMPEERLFLVPYTVDNDFFLSQSQVYRPQREELKAELGLPTGKVLILFASKLLAHKRPYDLLLAYEKLKRTHPATALLFVGAGSEEPRLQEYVQHHQVPDVYFLGFQNQTLLPKFFAVADMFVLPSDYESWGLIVNEVMCAGLPVLVTDEVGAVPDLVIHNRNGFVFRAGDVDALTEHLASLVRDPDLREQFGRASLEIISDWDYDKCVQGIRDALRYARQRRARR